LPGCSGRVHPAPAGHQGHREVSMHPKIAQLRTMSDDKLITTDHEAGIVTLLPAASVVLVLQGG
jgi:hypothetical protein